METSLKYSSSYLYLCIWKASAFLCQLLILLIWNENNLLTVFALYVIHWETNISFIFYLVILSPVHEVFSWDDKCSEKDVLSWLVMYLLNRKMHTKIKAYVICCDGLEEVRWMCVFITIKITKNNFL